MPRDLPSDLAKAFDPEAFRKAGHQIIDLLADYLTAIPDGAKHVMPNESADDCLAHWQATLRHEQSNPREYFQAVIERAFHIHHPGNLGHQVGANLPITAAAECVSALLDTGNGVYEVGNPATPMERLVIQDLARRFGLPETADGVLVSGGSLGNLTALLAARQNVPSANIWEDGSTGKGLCVLVSAEAHYSIDRAVRIMGWGANGARAVPVDAHYRMSTKALALAYDEARHAGLQVVAVVASACSTATGAFDPLEEIADFCADHRLWLHVDAAHGGAAAFSAKYRPLLAGIERADSVIMDYHKLLMTPTLTTAVVFSRGENAFQAFSQKAGYLWKQDDARDWQDLAKRTVECTKPMLGFRVYTVLHLVGTHVLESYIDRAFDLAKIFATLLTESDEFELLVEPQTNIVCYRHTPLNMPESELNTHNDIIRDRLVRNGHYFVTQVEKHGNRYLRSALMSPFTSKETLLGLLGEISALAKAKAYENAQ